MSSYYGSSGSRRGDEWTWTSWSQSTSWHHSGGWNGSGGSQAAMAHSSNKDGWWWGDSQGWSNGAQSWYSRKPNEAKAKAEGPDIAGCSEPGADACIKGHGQNLVESSEAYEKRRRLRARGCGGHGSGGSGSSPGRPGRPGCPGPAGAQADACHGGHGGHGHGDLGERREALEGADVGCLLC
ncbi:unnamed protein product [Symbiodinium microadriaticum]|nr:unnamed protein product [Symbiodinium sp. KB8]CAE7869554.1 unnamed protein product [Symbiodinium microadriaticum]